MRKLKMQDALAGFVALGASVAMVSCGGGGGGGSTASTGGGSAPTVSGYVTDGPVSASVFVYNASPSGALNLCGSDTSDMNNGGAFNISLTGQNCGQGPYLIEAVVLQAKDNDVSPGTIYHYIAVSSLSNIYINPINDAYSTSVLASYYGSSISSASRYRDIFVDDYRKGNFMNMLTSLEQEEEQINSSGNSVSFTHVFFAYSKTISSVSVNGSQVPGSIIIAKVEELTYPINLPSSLNSKFTIHVTDIRYEVDSLSGSSSTTLSYHHGLIIIPKNEMSNTALIAFIPRADKVSFYNLNSPITSPNFEILSISTTYNSDDKVGYIYYPYTGSGTISITHNPGTSSSTYIYATFLTPMPIQTCSPSYTYLLTATSSTVSSAATLSIPCGSQGATSLTKTVSIIPSGDDYEDQITFSGTIAGVPVSYTVSE